MNRRNLMAMVELLFPGVYVEELTIHTRPIEGVSTSTAAFIGASARTLDPVVVSSFAEFSQAAGMDVTGFLALAIRGFFENGGRRCYAALVHPADGIDAGLASLAQGGFSMLCCTDEGLFDHPSEKLVDYCKERKDVFCILQSAQPQLPDASHKPPTGSSYAAYYYPWLVVAELDGHAAVTIPPGGHIAGGYARVDAERGVHHAPAGIALRGVTGLSRQLGQAEVELLSSRRINLLRNVPGQGILIWSARTTSDDADWRYVNVRRLMIFVEQSISAGLQWAVLEPDGPALWVTVRRTIEDFLLNLWQTGALRGQKAEEAFFVRCDRTTMTQSDVDSGRFVAIVGLATIRAAEFLLLRVIGQTRRPE